ncbi:MAG: glutamine--fructose-6-phosphate transaminase (isomerizing) [Deltaproteobacteria bacterium]|nr:glutamine--fructose-6-phosphate transaminase (isomerizing) [Deltaproteobacteria bacterium]MBK8234973.1 glutamine--fructose-6-phosphate transaminase (isomerizing) [Deltaproteobacteria bacterium]MBK8716715.1 glutamine--fructose-6-phosphate transaminase (isomerizing) [Deltaproteobacteria bacterium]MBP7285318.1 glutamine--fructose-6-phosphate transaminase (isomerizing) [Nannocystaceae bacterium]
MCGIVGYTGHREATPLLLEGLRRLEYRGYDSAGVAVLSGAGAPARVARCEGKLQRLRDLLEREPLAGTCGIGHTRWATHGRPTEANAHPHRQGKVSIIHNGIIENHLELRQQLEAVGCRFGSETDSEIFAHLVDREVAAGGELRVAVSRALAQVRGTWAICVLHDDHPHEVVAARHNAPLLLGLGESDKPENFVASDVAAILEHTRRVVDLEDGDTARLTRESIEVYDATGKRVDRPERRVDWSPVAAEKEGFKHFMLKEIHEQPRVISDALAGRMSPQQAEVRLDGLDLDFTGTQKLLLLACGTSWHAAMCGKYMLEKLARIPVEVDLASEFRYRDPVVQPGTLAVAVSQSGETADTMAALREAKRLGATTLAICNVVGSSIARAADHVVYTHAGPEISVASTKAFTSQLTIFVLLSLHVAKRRGTLDDAAIQRAMMGLSAVPEAMNHLLGQLPAIRTIARRYMHARDFLYLGRGLGFPVALEGALKLKEISYVHAEGYASGEMKHGPIALVDENLPVVVIALRGPGYEKVLSNLAEVRARGGKIIALATMGDREIADMADDVVVVPDVDELLQPLLASIPLQLLAYHIADLRGTDVDQPRNLAKSVTVE